MSNSDSDSLSCLGLLSLATASWLIALVQLSYNAVSLITDLDCLHSSPASLLCLSLALSDLLGILAAFTLAVGNTILSRQWAGYLLVWLGLTSLHPLLTLTQVLQQALNLQPRLVAEVMTRDGVQFVLTIYCMFLMGAHYREITHKNSQESVIKNKLKNYNTI